MFRSLRPGPAFLLGPVLGSLLGQALGSAALSAQQSRASTFEAGDEGWTQSGAASFVALPSGGNPGGYLEIDNSEGPITYLYAPPAMLGDLRVFDGGTIAFDGNMLGIGGTPWTSAGADYGHVRLTSPAGVRTLDLLPAPGQPSQGSWTTYSMPLDAATWGSAQPTWSAILADVTEIRISVEAMFGAEVQGFDNFRLSTRVDAPWSEVWNGNGLNAVILHDTSASAPAPAPPANAPAIGKNWTARLDCTFAGQVGGTTVLKLVFGPRANPIPTIYGEILIPLSGPSRTLTMPLPASRVAGFGPVLIPNTAALIGVQYTVQGACPALPVSYVSNALYEVVGT